MHYQLIALLVIFLTSCSQRVPAPIRRPDVENQNYVPSKQNKIKTKDTILSKPILTDKNEDLTKNHQNTDIKEDEYSGYSDTSDEVWKKVNTAKEQYNQTYAANKDQKSPPHSMAPKDDVKKAEQVAQISPKVENIGELPVQGKIIVTFGEQFNGVKQNGIIIAAKLGSNIIATNYGKVVFAGYHKTFGNLVIVKNESANIYFAYAHMQDIVLEKNDLVTKGQVIGKVGATGEAEEPMLYFAIKNNTTPIDPIKFLNIKNK
ncbi:MAG: M23 family metallopeptidase [Rickettsiaceae bacterium]|nr:M23 family metallopeptidase [Rickettsiaceae bacterium]